jgi:hypothetical protein
MTSAGHWPALCEINLTTKGANQMWNMKWFWHWSEASKAAFIVDVDGYTVCHSKLTMKAASEIVREHNRLIEQLEQAK